MAGDSGDDLALLLFAAAGLAYWFLFQDSGSGDSITVENMGTPAASPSIGGGSPTSWNTYGGSPSPQLMPTDYSPMMMPLNVSPDGRQFIMAQEGLRLSAYGDAGHQAIGYGHQLAPGESYPSGISQAQAVALFNADLSRVEQAINSAVNVPLSQGQYDALASLIYNIGVSAFLDSTLLATLNGGDYAGADAQFAVWNVSSGRVNPVLVARRAAEAQMFGNSGGGLFA